MKKNKTLTLTILIIISLLFAGCTKTESNNSEASIESSEEQFIPISELTVPSYLNGAETDSFSIVEEHEDSVTYHLDENQQTETLNKIAAQIKESLNQVVTDKQYYPNIVEISFNENYSICDVTFSGTEINTYETTLRMSLYIAGNKFQLYQGNPEASLLTVVNYIDDSTGEIFSAGDSGSLK